MNLETLLVIIVVTGIISLMAGSLFKEDKEVEELYISMKPKCLHEWSIYPPTDKLTCIKCDKIAGSS